MLKITNRQSVISDFGTRGAVASCQVRSKNAGRAFIAFPGDGTRDSFSLIVFAPRVITHSAALRNTSSESNGSDSLGVDRRASGCSGTCCVVLLIADLTVSLLPPLTIGFLRKAATNKRPLLRNGRHCSVIGKSGNNPDAEACVACLFV